MTINLNYNDFEGKSGSCHIDKKPDTCPVCGVKINPEFICSYKLNEDYGGYEYLEVVFKCTDQKCNHLFVGYYHSFRGGPTINRDHFSLRFASLKFYETNEEFPKTINQISPKFSRIYNQSLLVEENGLNEICGPGYRRALEFLVKDYLISNSPKLRNEIAEMQLGDAIKIIQDVRIQSCAEKAAWLGNDETHYIRKHTDKDIEDLKTLIKLTTNWIDSEVLSKEYSKMKSANKKNNNA